MNDINATTRGLHHLGLSVPDIEAMLKFFTEALGFKKVGGNPEYPAYFISDGTIMLTLWQVENPDTAIAFDRRLNIGLHHFAVGVDNLKRIAEVLSSRDDVEIEFSPEPLGESALYHMMCRIPGNIRMELIEA